MTSARAGSDTSCMAALQAAGSALAVAEQLNDGLLALAWADAPGASETFAGSVTA
ncbi:CinA family protein [Kitasatospora sp. NPDC001309]|uniref:CinA family protein n=1 Tax=Kitasatospora sp. NPDC001309 TaxID=3364013 RepID=UPI0036A69A84